MPSQMLLKAGPFTGLNTKAEPYYLEEGYGGTATNVDISANQGAFTSALGRDVFATIAVPSGYTLQAVVPIVSFSGEPPNLVAQRLYVFSAINGTNSYQGWYDPVKQTTNQLVFASPFTKAVQFGSALWTNGGDKIYYKLGGALESDVWQVNVPYQYSYQVQGTWLTVTGNAPVDTYTYAITIRKSESWNVNGTAPNLVLTPDVDSLQESSPVFSTNVTIDSSSKQPGITVPAPLDLGTLIHGFTPGQDEYYGALYRSRLDNPTFTFVDYLANIPIVNDHNGNPSLIDTYSDPTIADNAPLVDHHDVPPILGQTYPGAIANNSTPSKLVQSSQQVVFTYRNPAYIAKHKSRMWVFTLYPTEPIGQSPQSAPETISLQPQLWFSDESVPWSFDDVNGVLPIGPEDTPGNHAIDGNVSSSPPWDPGFLEDTPTGLASTGSILVAFKTQSTWLVLGNSPDEFNVGVRKAFSIGCMAPNSIVEQEGGIFWLAPQGAYFFNGGEPEYISEDVSDSIEACSWADQQNAIGSYRNRTYYLSFPAAGFTLAYYTPSKKWYQLPYAPILSIFTPFNQNQLLFVSGNQLQTVDVDPAKDLGSSIVSTWTGAVTDSGAPGQLKGYSYLQVIAPIQPGKITVTLATDSGSEIPNTYAVTFDLSLGNGAHVVQLPKEMHGYTAQLTIQTTTDPSATQPIVIRDVVVTGQVVDRLVTTQTPDLLTAYFNGELIYP